LSILIIFVANITIIMKGRPNIHQNKELILKAQEVFWERGYNATSLTDLTNATGAGAGSLYNTFKGGKRELFKKALQQRKEELNIFRESLKNCDHPISLIKKFFLDLADADKRDHFKGCIVANTVIEMALVDDELQNEAVLILKETEQLYTLVISEEQDKGTITSKLPAEVIGKYLITFWCGINSLRRIYPDSDILKQQIEIHLKILD
jgi:TetR/AcrR family transcriptional repressor of nem operon